MNLDPMIFVNGLMSLVVIKSIIAIIFVAVAFGIFNRLMNEKIKKIKPIKLSLLISFIIAMFLLVLAFILLNNLK